ncbi:hypothetical protein OHA21_19705 [Actinoplanes sp. NBC_00393]|uniref:hypothetical protein n=1 Tax=Actinoplanes sp. NBC_00393 TaxID=2975953 RepID=UPI002E1B2C81
MTRPEHQQRPSRLGGFWGFLVGGAAVALLLVVLQPVTDPKDCPNYGAAGNASVFANSAWDFYLPLVLLGWLVLVVAEQAHPAAWWGRTRTAVAGRAVAAVSLTLVAACCLGATLLATCR